MEIEKLWMVRGGVITTHPTSADAPPGQVADCIRLFYIWQMITVPLLMEWSR